MSALLIWVAIVWLGVVNLGAFIAFAWDKRQARRDGRRVPERTLLGLAGMGGGLGAEAGRQWLRHKTYKQPFGRYLRLIQIGWLLALASLAVWSFA